MLALSGASIASDDPFADDVVTYVPGSNPVPQYTDPSTALGSPTRFTGGDFDPRIVSVFNPAWQPDEIVSIGAGGSLVLRFDTPVTDDAQNPFGIDLIIFGNALLVDGDPQDGICPPVAQLISEGGTIELSADGVNWMTVPDTVADGLFPTEGYLDHTDPYATTAGSVESNFTLPVDPAVTLADFNGASYADIQALYRGSGGGVGIDIAPLGFTSIRYVRISNPPGAAATPEIDAAADVTPRRPGDVTGDGAVNVFDLVELLQLWGPAHPYGWSAEFTGDAAVDVFDLIVLLEHWGS